MEPADLPESAVKGVEQALGITLSEHQTSLIRSAILTLEQKTARWRSRPKKGVFTAVEELQRQVGDVSRLLVEHHNGALGPEVAGYLLDLRETAELLHETLGPSSVRESRWIAEARFVFGLEEFFKKVTGRLPTASWYKNKESPTGDFAKMMVALRPLLPGEFQHQSAEAFVQRLKFILCGARTRRLSSITR